MHVITGRHLTQTEQLNQLSEEWHDCDDTYTAALAATLSAPLVPAPSAAEVAAKVPDHGDGSLGGVASVGALSAFAVAMLGTCESCDCV